MVSFNIHIYLNPPPIQNPEFISVCSLGLFSRDTFLEGPTLLQGAESPSVLQQHGSKRILMDIKGDLLWRIGWHSFGGWETPRFAVCKLETPKSWWCGSESEGLKTWRASGINPSLRARGGEGRCLGSKKREKREKFLPFPPFVLFRPSMDRVVGTHIMEGNLLSPLIQMLISPQNTLLGHSEIMFHLGTPWSGKLTHKTNLHKSILCRIGTYLLNHTYLQINTNKVVTLPTRYSYCAYNRKHSHSLPRRRGKVLEWCLHFSLIFCDINTMM